MTEHPITPPPELVEQWWEEAEDDPKTYFDHVATEAARWGADQELEACCEWLRANGYPGTAFELNDLRRPKPPSLKEQALAALGSIERGQDRPEDTDIIRRALEALPE